MFPSLRAEMARYGVKTKDIAELLKLNRKTAERKLAGSAYVTNVEMWKIRDGFFPGKTIDYLFSTNENGTVC